jgi:hypothetical protein
MENKTTAAQAALTNSFERMATTSIKTIRSAIENVSLNIGELNTVMSKMGIPMPGLLNAKKDSDCCAPKDECPPHCLIQLTRHAYAGESIMVPFGIKNVCKGPKQYRLGVRELRNIDGTIAPSQPLLNKNTVTLDQGETEMALMKIDLSQFAPGTYTAEIVIREKDINQNICFNLIVDTYNDVPVATPLDEKKYRLHWQSWQRHFYCENLKLSQATVRQPPQG